MCAELGDSWGFDMRPSDAAQINLGTDYGGGSFGGGKVVSGGGGQTWYGVGAMPAASAPAPSGYFDINPQTIAAAGAKGNVASDVQSAYQTYLSGTPVGRGGTYALDNIKRGYVTNVREGAAQYLRGVGIPFIEQITQAVTAPIIDPSPAPSDSGVKTIQDPEQEGDPFLTLADLYKQMFSVNEPSAPSAPVVVVGESGPSEGGGSSMGLILLLLVGGGAAFYWFYLRKRMGGD